MAKKKTTSSSEKHTLTANDLKRYEAGEMTFQEMHQVEKILLEDNFYADAAEGITILQQEGVSTEKNLSDLQARLNHRIKQNVPASTQTFRFSKLWKPASIAAALLLIFGGTYYFFNHKNEDTLAVINNQETSTESKPVTAANSSAIEKDKTTTEQASDKIIPETSKSPVVTAASKASPKTELKNAEPAYIPEKSEVAVNNNLIKTDKVAENAVSVFQKPVMLSEKKAKASSQISDEEELNTVASNASGIETAVVSGIVLDENHEPMPNVTVNIKGQADGVKTNEEGKFYLKNARKGDIAIFNSLTLPQMEIYLNNNNSLGEIIYKEDNISLLAQPKISVSSPNELMFEHTNLKARPEFGWEAFQVYLKENAKRPPKAAQMNIRGRVIVSFTVNAKGDLSDFIIMRSLGYGCDEEAIRIIKNGPKWFPATKADEPVKSTQQVLIRFQ